MDAETIVTDSPSIAGLTDPSPPQEAPPPDPPPAQEAEPANEAPTKAEKKGAKAEAKKEPSEPEKPSPKAKDWAEMTRLERRARDAEAKAKEREAAAEKRVRELEEERGKRKAEEDEILEAVRARDGAKLFRLLGPEGVQKVTTAFLKSRATDPKTGKPAPQEVDIDALVEKKLAEREAAAEKKAAEEREAKEKAEQAATAERFASLTTQGIELVRAGGERFAQIRAELTGSPQAEKLFTDTLRAIHAAITSPEGWTIGGKTHRGAVPLDVALDSLEDAMVERAEKLLSDKVRARLTKPAEKPAEDGGTRKSETGGPSTLTQRLATETPASKASKAIPEDESPLARKQREEAELEARTIAETEAILAAALTRKKAS